MPTRALPRAHKLLIVIPLQGELHPCSQRSRVALGAYPGQSHNVCVCGGLLASAYPQACRSHVRRAAACATGSRGMFRTSKELVDAIALKGECTAMPQSQPGRRPTAGSIA